MAFDFLFSKKNKTETGETPSYQINDPRDVDAHCHISGNLHIRGDIFFSGTLRIDGRVEGKVSIYEGGKGSLVVSQGASITGPVLATSVLADGLIAGRMDVVDKLECRSHSIIRGEVTYGSIQMHDGATMEARCRQRDQIQQRGVGGKPQDKPKLGADFLATKRK